MSSSKIISSNSFRGQNILIPVYLLGFHGLIIAFLLSEITTDIFVKISVDFKRVLLRIKKL